MNVVLELLKLGMVGLIAGLFSSVLSNRDHRQRAWWEMRVESYRAAIEALSDIVYYYDRHYSAETENRELPADFKAKMDAFWDEAFPKVRRLADSGAFLFSERANAALKEFMIDGNEDSYFERLDNNLAKSSRCLEALVACSKADLSLRERWFDRWG